MSIFATWLSFDDDHHEPSCGVYELIGPADGTWPEEAAMSSGGSYYRRVKRPCTCDTNTPIIYRGSHVNPADDHPRGGEVEVAAIPNNCHPSVRGENGEIDGPLVDFLRLSVDEDEATYLGGQQGSATVILTRRHVEELRDTLTAWLEAEVRG